MIDNLENTYFSVNLLIQDEIKNKQKELDSFHMLLKDIQMNNISFIKLWTILLQNNCKDVEIFEILAYNLFKNLDGLIIYIAKMNNLNCLVVQIFNVLIYLPVEWPINWRMDAERNLDVYLCLDPSIRAQFDSSHRLKREIERFNCLITEDSGYSFDIKEYIELLRNKAPLFEKLKCRYRGLSKVNAYTYYFLSDFWKDKKFKRNLSYYETKLEKNESKLLKNYIVPAYIKESYNDYVNLLKPIIEDIFEKECNLIYPFRFERWKEFCDEM